MFDILDGIIATGAVVLALSLVVQAIQQIIKQTLDLKSTYMRSELLALFGTPDVARLSAWISTGIEQRWHRRTSPTPVVKERGGNMLSRALATGVRLIPDSMLPSSLQEKLVEPEAKQIVLQLAERIRSFGYKDLELLENVSRETFKEMVKTLEIFRDSRMKGRLRSVLQEIDVWFDMSMKAFQNHYIRRMKYWAFGISGFVVLVANANLFEVYRDFSSNKPVRDAAVAMGERLLAVPRDSIPAAQPALAADTGHAAGDAPREEVRIIGKNIEQIRGVLESNTFQLWRWNRAEVQRLFSHTSVGGWLMHIFGWLTMVLLVSLGAPFWYDFLKAVMGVKEKLKSVRDQ